MRQILKAACKFRNMTWPKGAMGIQLQFTADLLSKWIRSNILRFKHILVPCHIPSSKVREKPHQSLKDFLHNNKQWNEWIALNPAATIPCRCQEYKNLLSDHCLYCFLDGHVVAGFEDLSIHPAAF